MLLLSADSRRARYSLLVLLDSVPEKYQKQRAIITKIAAEIIKFRVKLFADFISNLLVT